MIVWVVILGCAVSFLFGCLLGTFSGFLWGQKHTEKQARGEAERAFRTYQEAMARLQTKTSAEYVQEVNKRDIAHLQIQQLQDALAKEQAEEAQQQEELEPPKRIIKGFDSKGKLIEVDLNEGWEIQE